VITFHLCPRKVNFCMFCKMIVTHRVITREPAVQRDVFHTCKKKGNFEAFQQRADIALWKHAQLLCPEQIPVVSVPIRGHAPALSPGGMSHLVFPHTEHLTLHEEEAALKLLTKNSCWPGLTFGSHTGIVWEIADSHGPQVSWGVCCCSCSVDGHTSAILLWACSGGVAMLVEA